MERFFRSVLASRRLFALGTHPEGQNAVHKDVLGGLRKKMPVTHITMLIATLSICGFPFFSGFLSKDEIINASLSFYSLPENGGLTIIFPISLPNIIGNATKSIKS